MAKKTRKEKIQELINTLTTKLEDQTVLTDCGDVSFGSDHAYTAAHYIVSVLDEKGYLKI